MPEIVNLKEENVKLIIDVVIYFILSKDSKENSKVEK